MTKSADAKHAEPVLDRRHREIGGISPRIRHTPDGCGGRNSSDGRPRRSSTNASMRPISSFDIEAIQQHRPAAGLTSPSARDTSVQISLGRQQHGRVDVLLCAHAELFATDATRRNPRAPRPRRIAGSARRRESDLLGVYSAMSSTPNDAAYEIRRGRSPVSDSSASRNCFGMSAYRARHTWSLPTTTVRNRLASRARPAAVVPAISMYEPVLMFRATNARSGAVTRRDISHCLSVPDREMRRNQRYGLLHKPPRSRFSSGFGLDVSVTGSEPQIAHDALQRVRLEDAAVVPVQRQRRDQDPVATLDHRIRL